MAVPPVMGIGMILVGGLVIARPRWFYMRYQRPTGQPAPSWVSAWNRIFGALVLALGCLAVAAAVSR